MSVSGLFCKDSASDWNDKTKYAVFVFHSRAPPILFKDASEWNDKTKHAVFVFIVYLGIKLYLIVIILTFDSKQRDV